MQNRLPNECIRSHRTWFALGQQTPSSSTRRPSTASNWRACPAPGGKLMHASVRIGDSVLMLVDELPEWGMLGPKVLKGSPVTIHLYVANVDAVVAQAVTAGAKVTMPIADMLWGDRYAQLE